MYEPRRTTRSSLKTYLKNRSITCPRHCSTTECSFQFGLVQFPISVARHFSQRRRAQSFQKLPRIPFSSCAFLNVQNHKTMLSEVARIRWKVSDYLSTWTPPWLDSWIMLMDVYRSENWWEAHQNRVSLFKIAQLVRVSQRTYGFYTIINELSSDCKSYETL